MDSQEVVYLVQPFIEGMYDSQIAAVVEIQAARVSDEAKIQDSNGSDIRSPQTTPEQLEAFLIQTNITARSLLRLTDYLVICDGGPAGSTPTRWNAHVTAAVEAALEILDAYQMVTATLKEAVPGSPLGNISAGLNIQDLEILSRVQNAFLPVLTGSCKDYSYQLRLTNNRKCLNISLYSEGKIPAKFSAALSFVGLVGICTSAVTPAISWGTFIVFGAAMLCQEQETSHPLTELTIEPTGGNKGKLAFVPCLDTTSYSYSNPPGQQTDRAATGEFLRYNMDISLLGVDAKISVATDEGSLQIFKVLHPDERFCYSNRVVRIKDRIVLKAESRDELLSREEDEDGTWEVGYGGGNHCWTITKAI